MTIEEQIKEQLEKINANLWQIERRLRGIENNTKKE